VKIELLVPGSTVFDYTTSQIAIDGNRTHTDVNLTHGSMTTRYQSFS
jgi:hypothetical protein